MKLSERLRIQAQIEQRFQAASISEVSPNPVDDLHLAADIIDSLPTAQDGSPIWKGCHIVAKAIDRFPAKWWGPITSISHLGVSANGVQVIPLDQIASTHRTREEAEAAAKRAGGEG